MIKKANPVTNFIMDEDIIPTNEPIASCSNFNI